MSITNITNMFWTSNFNRIGQLFSINVISRIFCAVFCCKNPPCMVEFANSCPRNPVNTIPLQMTNKWLWKNNGRLSRVVDRIPSLVNPQLKLQKIRLGLILGFQKISKIHFWKLLQLKIGYFKQICPVFALLKPTLCPTKDMCFTELQGP